MKIALKIGTLIREFRELALDLDSKLHDIKEIEANTYEEYIKKSELAINISYTCQILVSYGVKIKYELAALQSSAGTYETINQYKNALSDIKDDLDKYKAIMFSASESSKSIREILNIKYNTRLN